MDDNGCSYHLTPLLTVKVMYTNNACNDYTLYKMFRVLASSVFCVLRSRGGSHGAMDRPFQAEPCMKKLASKQFTMRSSIPKSLLAMETLLASWRARRRK